jgi:hypothetical protein
MKRLTSWCVQLTACFLLAAAAALPAQAADADPTGTWTWSTPGRDGGEPRESTLKIKKQGDKLMGTLSQPGRQQATETEIKDMKLTGEELTFSVTRERQGNSFTQKYKGKVAADTITGKVSFDRGGETTERDWVAKRKKEDKKDAAK